ncbi:Bifunctional epoxide hydrolase 2 [Escovopsis weberi]|uniref:Bifunctional epoxide hydrolase 2 n=1 Tax=Escovopsis weberi TaxID=150374 RepID=A0A0M9VRX4_ESCWE|nr:Bifunctional epoxide hydrolase 2 [Escovopsis weberi]
MDTSKLKPNDPRVKYETAVVRGKTYSYILGEPQGPKRDTVLLVHGFPDMAFGWRHQIPYLMSLGFQVVAPNLLGYPGTDAPRDLSHYTLRSVAADLAELMSARFVGAGGQIVLGGHDWGGALIWRMALWHPRLVKAVFALCTPMLSIPREYVDLETLVESGALANFRYQLQFGGPVLQDHFQTREDLRRFFRVLYGGTVPGTAPPAGCLGPEGVMLEESFKLVGAPRLLDADELEHYAARYAERSAECGGEGDPLRGPLSWYRTRRLNFDDDVELLEALGGAQPRFAMPALFVAASRDRALPPAMAAGMERFFDDLKRDEIDATHFVLTEEPDKTNASLGRWLDGLYHGELKASL